MIKFSIPVICSDDRLLSLVNTDYIDEFYDGADDCIGRSFFCFNPSMFSKSQFASCLKKIHYRGLKLNYMLDATCIGNQELTIRMQKKIKQLLNWIIDNNIDAVTIAVPYLLEFIKYNYPKLKVYVSIAAGVDALERAEYWDELGADRITLSAVSGINRNFKLLRKIRDNITCQLELIANLSCLNECPFWTYHSSVFSHISQHSYLEGKSRPDYCLAKCNYIKTRDPVEFIRSGWIRPEDLRYYEELGINRIKLVTENSDSAKTIRVLNAYYNRYYEGNLLDILFDGLKGGSVIYIDNQKLNGFLEYFINENCNQKSCQSCDYCISISNQVTRIDDVKRLSLLSKYERQFNESVGTL